MNTTPHIVVVDDNPAIRSILRRCLQAEGWAVSEAGSRAALMQCLEMQPVDLITLDLKLGDGDGLEIARSVRAARNIPIIMITGKDMAEDRIAGLENGADDYIVKPFAMSEVVSSVRSVLGRYRPIEAAPASDAMAGVSERFRFEAGVLDVARRDMHAPCGQSVELTGAEFDLLTILVRRPRRIFSSNEMMQLLQAHNLSPAERTVDKLIARLRSKIEAPGDAPRFIKSVRSIGYAFAGNVERI